MLPAARREQAAFGEFSGRRRFFVRIVCSPAPLRRWKRPGYNGWMMDRHTLDWRSLDWRSLDWRSLALVEPRPPDGGTQARADLSARDALLAASGLPASEPDSPLLVVINDPDRATRTREALEAVAELAGGRPLDVLVATGSHRFPDAMLAAHEQPLRRFAREVSWHDGRTGAHAYVGGVRLDQRLAEAPDVVGIGSAEPHWFAGVTGVHKTLTIGVMHVEDIERNHRLALEPTARPLRLEGNPLHEEHMRALRELCVDRAVLGMQHAGPAWFAGEPESCVEDALGAVRRIWLRTVPAPLDFLFARVEPPLDRTLYQADKGIKNSEFAVRDDGVIVLDARCVNGVGPDRFVRLLTRARDERSARSQIADTGYRLGDHKAVRLRALQARGVRLGLIAPEFPQDVAAVVGLDLLPDHHAAVRWIEKRVGEGATGACIDDAGNTVVEVSVA